MKWDKVLLSKGHFKDKRYLSYIIKVMSYIRLGTGRYWGDQTGAEIFRDFTRNVMTGKVTCRRAKYNCLDAIKLEVARVSDYGYTFRNELCFVIPKLDLIFSHPFCIREKDSEGKMTDTQYTVAVHNNKLILIQNRLELDFMCKVAEAWQYSWSKPRFTVSEFFDILATKSKVITLEDFHDKDTTQGKAA